MSCPSALLPNARPAQRKCSHERLDRKTNLQSRVMYPARGWARERHHWHLLQNRHLDLIQQREPFRVIHLLMGLIDKRIGIPCDIAEMREVHVVRRLAHDGTRIIECVQDRLSEWWLAGAV